MLCVFPVSLTMQTLTPWYDTILQITGGDRIEQVDFLQSLWSGYGVIARLTVAGSKERSVIAKLVEIPEQVAHPRGWNTALSHKRKVRSYRVERHWYDAYAARCGAVCRVANVLGMAERGPSSLIVLEDLDFAGFDVRHESLSTEGVEPCIAWLAAFHATFLGEIPEGLWTEGTYWHLATRPDEWEAITEPAIKSAAAELDSRLTDCCYRTFVHGDAKLANFCFDATGKRVAAVDFQYVGGGCGMKDLAYLLGSCLSDRECRDSETRLLNHYFFHLEQSLERQAKHVDLASLRAEWEFLYPVAWADFYRFLQGWSPDHGKINGYMLEMTEKALATNKRWR